MRAQDVAKLSTRMFKTNPGRTWLTILGMGVGTGAVVVLVGLGFGLQGIILDQIVLGDTLLSLNVSNPPNQKVLLDTKITQEFLQLPGVKDVASMVSYPALITYEGLTGNVYLQGTVPEYFKYTGIKLDENKIPGVSKEKEGRLFSKENETVDQNSVILTKAVLRLFGVATSSDAIGKKVSFRVYIPTKNNKTEEVDLKKQYTVIGVTSDASNIAAVLTLKEFSSQLPVSNFERTQVRVESTDDIATTTEAILEKGFIVTALSKTVDQANKIFQGVQAVLAVFGGIALIVSAIGMFNTMTVTLLERTAEIGIMRTLGASSNDIKLLFVSEAVIVGFLGGVVGILFGVGLGLGLNMIINVAASKLGGVSMKMFSYPIVFLLFIASFSGIVGFLTGIFPAKRAAKLDPLDAIRYK
ncbi:MAG: ABC transporter permease [Candidatus Pacebacteria bacterium]|nr:ABC transporter permease [Candidatus Paceibacterota bacterium]